MITIHRTSLLALALALPVAVDRQPSPPNGSREALRALDDPSLGELRAGRIAASGRLGEDDRAALQAAQEQSGQPLLEMRAGDTTLTTVLLVALVVVVILLLI